MPRPYNRLLRLSGESRFPPSSFPVSRTDFYREELLKHRQCLRDQRESFSEHAISEVEAAIAKTIAELDQLCSHCDCDHIVSCVLRKLDQVTNLSAIDRNTLH
jgi:hypothetical protein